MRELILDQRNIYNGNLILVNGDHPIKEEYYIANTKIPVDIEHRDILLEFKVATVLSHIIDDLAARDSIVPVSGYRTGHEQKSIYLNSLIDNGEDFTRKYVARPDHSEHQLGLAIDVGKRQKNVDFIRPEFPYEGIYNQFRKKSIKYGFIERYEKHKEKITKIAQEPWHFRYVGYPHSYIMKIQDLCLEEYIELLKGYPYNKKHFYINVDNHNLEMFYVPIISTKSEVIHLPEDKIHEISGNNVDGCIITLWK